ncbi:hypothetical protein AKO1_007688 [Acrasis kona]|uniref:COMM domain-containing protein n=1 Tax=Acrasis kona TaxID=1008807 RepID=A0AAW2YQQ8_9EUKA
MFKNTTRFQSAVSVINEVDAGQFPKLLQRILDGAKRSFQSEEQKKTLTVGGAFTQAEGERLQELFSLSSTHLELLVDACSYVFEHALYNSLNPDRLLNELSENTSLTEEHARAFQLVWQENSRNYLNNAKDRTLGGPSLLKNFSWRLQIHLSEDALSKQKQTNALFEFETGQQKQEANDKFVVEFTQEELHSFFSKLEVIQGQLDRLSA